MEDPERLVSTVFGPVHELAEPPEGWPTENPERMAEVSLPAYPAPEVPPAAEPFARLGAARLEAVREERRRG